MPRTNRPPTRPRRRAAACLATLILTVGISACDADPTVPSVRPAPGEPPATARVKQNRSGFLSGAGGVALFYQLVGNGPDTVIVLHGGPGLSMSHLVPDIDRLAEGRTLIFFDQRGGGYSPLPNPDPSALSVDLFVADVEAARQHLALKRVTLLGHSWGAILAGLYAAAHADRVERLVLLDPGPIAPPYFTEFSAAVSTRLTVDDFAQYGTLLALVADGPDPFGSCEAALTLLFSHYQHDPASIERMRGRWCGGSLTGIRQGRFVTRNVVLTAIADLDLRPLLTTALAGRTVPALVLYGDAEPIPLASAEDWAAAIPGARLVVLPHAGHFPWLEANPVAKEFFKVVGDFLRHS